MIWHVKPYTREHLAGTGSYLIFYLILKQYNENDLRNFKVTAMSWKYLESSSKEGMKARVQ